MKALPNLNDEDAMLEQGRRSALGKARNDAAEALRDACTEVQGAGWQDLYAAAEKASQAADRLKTLAAMWDGL